MEKSEEPVEQDDPESPPEKSYCTSAVTGSIPAFQAIFICHECLGGSSEGGTTPLCICQACADHCHSGNDHDVEYIGLGPSYCDCDHVKCCTLMQDSKLMAETLGVVPFCRPIAPSTSSKEDNMTGQASGTNGVSNQPERLVDALVLDSYDVPCLQDATLAEDLVEQARELVKHSKETFWLDHTMEEEQLCPLERLAWSIYQHHRQRYAQKLHPGLADQQGGAEWWVQFKDADSNAKEGAIDLHYDKDEALAETFGLGVFPTLSTVTYLTHTTSASPTIVLNHTYTQGEDNLIDTMLVSRPRLGKHLVFDGTLLHGAPAHAELKQGTPAKQGQTRMTFLVNVWKDAKPAKVQPLDPEIRQNFSLTSSSKPKPMEMTTNEVPTMTVDKEEDLPEGRRHRIELPFVTRGVTWEDQLNLGGGNSSSKCETPEDEDYEGEEEGGGLVIVTFPPPETEDSLLVKFGPGMQGYLDYPDAKAGASDDQDGDESERFQTGYV